MAEDHPTPVTDHEELLRRYAAGERSFARAILMFPPLGGANLQGANLEGAVFVPGDLGGVNLENANLRGAQLRGMSLGAANLRGADLRGAELSHAYLRGAKLSGSDLRRTRLRSADLRDTELQGASLETVDLTRADLENADLRGARCVLACFSGANVERANLEGADLTAAELDGASLEGANLPGANLSGAHLEGANLARAVLLDASMGRVHLSNTVLVDVDISPLCAAAPPASHRGASTIDFRSIVRSLHAPNLKWFLQATGMPEVFIEYMIDCARTLDQKGVFRMLQSTFISYGGPDTDFAQQLNDALLKNGVTTFFFAKDAIPGKKLHRLMRDGVNEHDRVILVCSQASLDRPGVLNEITETLQREARDGGAEYLVPITLDDYVFTGWKPKDPGLTQAIRDRVVADFRGAAADPAKFNEGVLKLIAALKK